MAQVDEDEEESEEDPPAPPYEPSLPLSNQSYHTPAIEPTAEGPQYQLLDIAGNPVNLEGTTAAVKKSLLPTLPEEGSGDKKRQACLKAFKNLHRHWKGRNK
jgi:hypothetical protein